METREEEEVKGRGERRRSSLPPGGPVIYATKLPPPIRMLFPNLSLACIEMVITSFTRLPRSKFLSTVVCLVSI